MSDARPLPQDRWFDNLPAEMRERTQWAWATCSLVSDRIDKAPLNAFGGPASVSDPRTWSTFDDAVKAVRHARDNGHPRAYVGFILSENDPFAGLDLDTYKADELYAAKIAEGVVPEIADKLRRQVVESHEAIRLKASTYTEISQSGKAGRLIGYGKLSVGRRGQNLETYSNERFLIMTGHALGDYPITDIQGLLDYIEQVAAPSLTREQVKEALAKYAGQGIMDGKTDAEIVASITGAQNGDRYRLYFQGGWSGDRSRLIADLLQNIARYSSDYAQIRRIAESSNIVQSKADRYKAGRVDLLESEIHWAVAKIVHGLSDQAEERERLRQELEIARTTFDWSGHHKDGAPVVPAVSAAKPPPPVAPVTPPRKGSAYPLGAEGSFRRAYYEYCKYSAIMDVDTIHRARVLYAMSTLFAPDLATPDGDGLALYLMVVARSGTGKDAFRNGTAALMPVFGDGSLAFNHVYAHVRERFAQYDPVSGAGGSKATQGKKGITFYTAEYFKSRAASKGNTAIEASVDRLLLDSYNRCQPDWGGSIQVLSQESRDASSPCTITFGCEGTVSDFKAMDLISGQDGSFARMLPFYTDEPRPDPLADRDRTLPPEMLKLLLTRLEFLHVKATGLTRVNLVWGEGAHVKAHELRVYFTRKANEHGDNGIAASYNRSAQIIMRVAGLIAFDDAFLGMGAQAPQEIVLTTSAIDEARAIYECCMAPILTLHDSGETGTGYDRKRIEVLKAMKKWFASERKMGTLAVTGKSGYVYAACVTQILRGQIYKDMGLTEVKGVNEVLRTLELEGILTDVTQQYEAERNSKRGRPLEAVYCKGPFWPENI